MTDESLMLDIDIIEKEQEELLAKKAEEYKMQLAEKDNLHKRELAEKDNEIQLLKQQIAALKKSE
jgi:uncharacterized membrane protein